MSRQEALEQFRIAQRSGAKYYAEAQARGATPYPIVLEDVLAGKTGANRVDMGEMEIPIARIIGTVADGRKAAFAGNFMPLLDEDSEFGAKWIALCEAHLSSTGITDPIGVIEYLGQFYVLTPSRRIHSSCSPFFSHTISSSCICLIKYIIAESPVSDSFVTSLPSFR